MVGLVRQPETVEVANWLIDKMGRGVLTAELLQPDELVSGIIAQVRAWQSWCQGRLGLGSMCRFHQGGCPAAAARQAGLYFAGM